MPNYCDFELKVVGEEGNVKLLMDYLKNPYMYYDEESALPHPDYERIKEEMPLHFKEGSENLYTAAQKHFYRVFDCIPSKGGPVKRDDGLYEQHALGYCAWSVYCCMLSGPGTYYSDNSEYCANLARAHATCLEEATKELNLKVEIYSSECGVGFAEHYIIDNGEIVTQEEVSYKEALPEDYSSREELEADFGPVTDEEWESGDKIIRCEFNSRDPYWNI